VQDSQGGCHAVPLGNFVEALGSPAWSACKKIDNDDPERKA